MRTALWLAACDNRPAGIKYGRESLKFLQLPLLVSVAWALLPLNVYAQKPIQSQIEWKTECIGHYLVSTPGDVEIALMPVKALTAPRSADIPAYFSDGIRADYATLPFPITQRASPEDFDSVRIKAAKNIEKSIKELADSPIPEERAEAKLVRPIHLDMPSIFGWDYGKSASIYLYRDGRIFQYADELASVQQFLKTLHSRDLYEVPTGKGQCIPYGFVAEERERRTIAVTLRLIEHPDVTIHLAETAPWRKSQDCIGNCRQVMTSKDQITIFWEYEYARLTHRTTLLGFPRFRDAKLAGQKGLETFVEILRPDDPKDYRYDDGDDSNNQVDYGYLAYAVGDREAEADPDARDLMLYVIRNARQSQGKPPVSRDELKAMAEAIAASVRRRH